MVMSKNRPFVTNEKIIQLESGDVMHGIKSSSDGFSNFGEAYFSEILPNNIKAWKRHKLITSNILVPSGRVLFVVIEEDINDLTYKEYIISKNEYLRLTIPPMNWYGFKGISDKVSVLMNITDQEHDPQESETVEIDKFDYDWSLI